MPIQNFLCGLAGFLVVELFRQYLNFIKRKAPIPRLRDFRRAYFVFLVILIALFSGLLSVLLAKDPATSFFVGLLFPSFCIGSVKLLGSSSPPKTSENPADVEDLSVGSSSKSISPWRFAVSELRIALLRYVGGRTLFNI
jgi:hypothetical protein